MSKHIDLGQYTVDSLGRYFELVPKELGADARRSKRGMTFETKSWENRGIGHLCVMRMNAFLGLMKMETIVIAPFEADLPLYNADWVKAFGTETQIAELYDTQLEPWPETSQKKFLGIKAGFADLPDAPSGEHWYDSVLYSCSIHKKGKGLTDSFNKLAKSILTCLSRNSRQLQRQGNARWILKRPASANSPTSSWRTTGRRST